MFLEITPKTLVACFFLKCNSFQDVSVGLVKASDICPGFIPGRWHIPHLNDKDRAWRLTLVPSKLEMGKSTQ